MSAFIVSEKTMNLAVDAMRRATAHDTTLRAKFPGLDRERGPFVALLGESDSVLTALGFRLYEMNADAVEARYHERQEVPVFRYSNRAHLASDVEAFKALRCLLYQCSEGNVPESELYRDAERAGHVLAEHIVRDLPAYNAAPWG
jgi:hypothetical protein